MNLTFRSPQSWSNVGDAFVGPTPVLASAGPPSRNQPSQEPEEDPRHDASRTGRFDVRPEDWLG